MNKNYLRNLFGALVLCIALAECMPMVNAQSTGPKSFESNALGRNLEAAVVNRLRSEPVSSSSNEEARARAGSSLIDSNWADASEFSTERTVLPGFPSRASENPQTNSPKQPSSSYVFPSRHERVHHYIKGVIGPTAFASAAVGAVYNHAYNRPEEWGKSGNALAKRFFSSYGRGAINETVKFGLSEMLDVDSSFHKSTRNGFGPRTADAILETVTSRTRSGRRVVSVPRLTGPYAGSFASLIWMPKRYGVEYGLRSGT
jgi:hypothetical protein